MEEVVQKSGRRSHCLRTKVNFTITWVLFLTMVRGNFDTNRYTDSSPNTAHSPSEGFSIPHTKTPQVEERLRLDLTSVLPILISIGTGTPLELLLLMYDSYLLVFLSMYPVN